MDVTIFSAAGCGKCVSTKYQLGKRGIPVTEVRADLNPEVKRAVENAVGRQLPVVMAFRSDDDEVPDIWSDFHPDYIDSLLDTTKAIPTL